MSELQNFHKLTPGTIDYRERHFKDNATLRLEQNNDPVLRNLRAKIEGEPCDETALTQDYRYKHYLQNIPRIEIRQDILTTRYYNDTDMISHYQILLPQQLLDEFLHALHGHTTNHSGITKMIQEARQKYYYPCIAKYIRTWDTKCQMCIQSKRINNDLLKTELLNCPEWDQVLRIYCKRIFFQTFPQVEVMTILSQQKTCFHAICSHTQSQESLPQQSQELSWTL